MVKDVKTLDVLLIPSDDAAKMDQLRVTLREALLKAGWLACWNEKYHGIHKLPKSLSDKTSPLLAVNEKIVWNGEAVPSVAQLTKMFAGNDKQKFSWKKTAQTHLSFIIAVLIAFFPKCPFCWAAYMSLLGAFGMESIQYQPWLLPVLIVMLFVNLASLYLSRKRHGYKPLALALTGGLLIVLNRFLWNEKWLIIIAALFMIAGSLWNSLPKRLVISLKFYMKRFLPS